MGGPSQLAPNGSPCVRSGSGSTYFFLGACLPLTGFFRACLATALGVSQDEVGVLGGSAASDFGLEKVPGDLSYSVLIFIPSAFMELRIAFPEFLSFCGQRVGRQADSGPDTSHFPALGCLLHRQARGGVGECGWGVLGSRCPWAVKPGVH